MRLVFTLGALTGTAAACDGDAILPGGGADAAAPQPRATAVTPAVYTTVLAFLGFGPQPGRVLLRLENRTSADSLELRYDGWRDPGGGWRTILDVREIAGVPRAAWRVLPVGSLRVSVREGEELASLAIGAAEGRLRLRVGERLAEWASATGQREIFRRAVLETGSDGQAGILLVRQTARLAGSSVQDREQVVLLADTLGNALLVLRGGQEGGTPVVVHSLLGETSRRWDGAELSADGSESGADGGASARVADQETGRWTLLIPGAEIEAEIAIAAGGGPTDGGQPTGISLAEATAVVRVAGADSLSMSGYQIGPAGPPLEGTEP